MSGSSEMVREIATEKYVLPALRAGKSRFTVAVKDVLRDLVAQGFPASNVPQVCSALRKRDFLQENSIEIEGIDGPPSKQSTTVVYRYRTIRRETELQNEFQQADAEDAAVRALRLSRRLRGLLKEELAGYGGGEAFLRKVRGYDEEGTA